MKAGQYKIIHVDGSETIHFEKPTIKAISKAIGAAGLDTVVLTRDASRANLVMFVDDTGAIDGKPANATATKMYHGICRPGTTHEICGDVAIVNDSDFT